MSDVRKINGKYYDFAPPNKSFLQTAFELKQLGIKNYYFPLIVNNPRVLSIDPFKPNITRQEMEALLYELKSNIWFYTRTVVKIKKGKLRVSLPSISYATQALIVGKRSMTSLFIMISLVTPFNIMV